MTLGDWLISEVEYGRNLADSGWKGARTAWDGVVRTEPVGEVISRSARASWMPTMAGVGVGALCAYLIQRGRPSRPVAIALGVCGGFLGFTAGVAWETREISSEVARGAMRQIGTTRDSHWLDRHPINFG